MKRKQNWRDVMEFLCFRDEPRSRVLDMLKPCNFVIFKSNFLKQVLVSSILMTRGVVYFSQDFYSPTRFVVSATSSGS